MSTAFSIRPARADDHAAFVRLVPELGVDDPIPAAEPWWRQRGPTTLLAEAGDEVLGYLYYELLGQSLYVRNLVTDPRARRRGVGRALLRAAVDLGRSAGATSWRLNVKDDNAAAIALYESVGLRTAFATRVLRVRCDDLPRAAGPEGEPGAPPAELDAAIERELELIDGQLARHRQLGRVLLGRFERGRLLAFASFDPAFAGAFPFFARSQELAWTLVRALAPHRRPGGEGWRATSLQIVLEDQEPLADELVRDGAQPVFRILHLRAALPG